MPVSFGSSAAAQLTWAGVPTKKYRASCPLGISVGGEASCSNDVVTPGSKSHDVVALPLASFSTEPTVAQPEGHAFAGE